MQSKQKRKEGCYRWVPLKGCSNSLGSYEGFLNKSCDCQMGVKVWIWDFQNKMNRSWGVISWSEARWERKWVIITRMGYQVDGWLHNQLGQDLCNPDSLLRFSFLTNLLVCMVARVRLFACSWCKDRETGEKEISNYLFTPAFEFQVWKCSIFGLHLRVREVNISSCSHVLWFKWNFHTSLTNIY